MGGKSVAKCVRTDLFFYACFGTISLDDIEDHNATQRSSKTVEKDIVFCSSSDGEFVAKMVV